MIHRMSFIAALACAPIVVFALPGGESKTISTDKVQLQDIAGVDFIDPPDSVAILPSVKTARGNDSLFIKRIVVSGSTSLTSDEMKKIVGPFEMRQADAMQLQQLMSSIAQAYRDKGYLDVSVLMPEQKVENGIVNFAVVENTITQVTIVGDAGRFDSFISTRTDQLKGAPLHLKNVVSMLDRLQYEQNVRVYDARLMPGKRPGESALLLQVDSQRSRQIELSVDNYQSPAIGAERLSIRYADKNALGYADAVSLDVGISQGSKSLLGSYTFPYAPTETRLTPYLAVQTSRVVEGVFEQFDFTQQGLVLGILATQPLFGLDLPLNASAGIEYHQSELDSNDDFLQAQGIGVGATYTVASASGLWKPYVKSAVLSHRASIRYGFGVDEPENANAHGAFWLTQLNSEFHKKVDGVLPATWLARADIQLTPNDVISGEKFAVGGVHSVRGYRQNIALFDNGVQITSEIRWHFDHLLRKPYGLTIYPFIDYAYGQNHDTEITASGHYIGTGMGLAGSIGRSWQARLDWAYGWSERRRLDNAQDYGIYLQIKYSYDRH